MRDVDIIMTKPDFKTVAVYMAGFQLLTLPTGLWAWHSGLTFSAIVLPSIFSGIIGGCFLQTAVFAFRTGYMQRMSTFYRFRERPISYIADLVMVLGGIILSVAWPIGYSLQELNR